MSSEIARALLGGECSCEPPCVDRSISCVMCGEPTTCLGFIWHAVKIWNREEVANAQRDNRRAEMIRPSEMGIACAGECTAKLHAQKHYEVQQEYATTRAYLEMLFVGKYNAESLAWLRKHGMSRQVNRVLNEEGQKQQWPTK